MTLAFGSMLELRCLPLLVHQVDAKFDGIEGPGDKFGTDPGTNQVFAANERERREVAALWGMNQNTCAILTRESEGRGRRGRFRDDRQW